MAGLAGWVDFARDLSHETDVVRAMTATLAHRGPDAEGLWTGPHAVLGHRRLAVLDPAGSAQPMVVEVDGAARAVLAYNGEIYNAAAVRAELTSRGHSFRTAGDTEVVLRAYLEWGPDC